MDNHFILQSNFPLTGTYELLNGQASDVAKLKLQQILKGKPWTFVNLLPVPVLVYMKMIAGKLGFAEDRIEFLAKIPPFEKVDALGTQRGTPLVENMEVHVLFDPHGNGKAVEICRPEFLRSDTRMVRIGDIVYDEQDMTYLNSHADIAGLRIINNIVIPLDIYHHGRRLGQVQGDDGIGYMFGSPNTIYLDNVNYGFRIGDEITFVFAYNNKKYATVVLNDNFMNNIYVGRINQKFTPPNPDIFAYRIDAPNVTGITYYEPIPGNSYKSRKTQPGADL
jgi:hypothetical protein